MVGRALDKMACLASISRICVDSKCISELANTFLGRQKEEMDAQQPPAGQSQPNLQSKLTYPDQSARWYISERLPRTIWMKTDGKGVREIKNRVTENSIQ